VGVFTAQRLADLDFRFALARGDRAPGRRGDRPSRRDPRRARQNFCRTLAVDFGVFERLF